MSGRPQVLLIRERLIERISGHDGVRRLTCNEIADDFARRSRASSDTKRKQSQTTQ